MSTSISTTLPLGSSALPPVETAPAVAAPHTLDRRWDPLLGFVALYIITAVGRVHQLFPVVGVLRPALLAGAIAIVLYLVDGRASRRLHRSWVGPTTWLVALFAWMLLSVPSALVIGNSFNLVINNFAKTVAMFFIVASTIRGTRDLERLMLAYFAGAAVYAAVVLARFSLGGADDWRLGHLYYYDANDFATFIVTAIPFGLYFLHTQRPAARLLAAAALLVLTVAFVHTGSRGGFIAMVIVMAYVLVSYSAIAAAYRIGAIVLVLAVLFATANDRYWTQMTTILEPADYNRTEETGRLQIWSRGVGYMLRFPIFGVGPANFPTAEGTLASFADRQQIGRGVRWNAAHNSYIQVGAELGFPGLIFFVALFVVSLRWLWRVRRARFAEGHAARSALSHALSASLIGFAVGAAFLSLAYSEMFYALLALVVGLIKTTFLQNASRRPESPA